MKNKGVVFLAAALALIMLGSFGSINAGLTPQSATVQSAEANVLAERRFADAVTLLRQENFAEAIAAYEKVIQLLPASPIAQDARYWIGQTYLRMEKYNEALAVFKKLLKDHPASPIVPVTQLMISRAEQEIEVQKTRVKEAVASDPSLIVDPANGAEFRRSHTFSGKSDVLLGLGGFFSPNGRFLLIEKTVIPLDGSEPFPLTETKRPGVGPGRPTGRRPPFTSRTRSGSFPFLGSASFLSFRDSTWLSKNVKSTLRP